MKELVVGNPIYDKELKVLGLITALPYGENNKFQYIWVDKKGYIGLDTYIETVEEKVGIKLKGE